MVFTPQFLDEIRTRLILSELIGRRVRLALKGREYIGLCPFHNEKTPSFTVNNEKGFFHCFGCGAHGDVIGFIMRDEGLSFPEAVERLCGEAGMEVPLQENVSRAAIESRLSLYGVLEEATKVFENQLYSTRGAVALSYLQARGLTRETIKTFRLGCAIDGRNSLKVSLEEKHISEDLMVTSGLLVKGQSANEAYDRFRNRIIFPIQDRRGRVIAFGGRAIENSSQAKYLNSPDTPLFHKGSVLYAIHLAKGSARKAGRIIAVEGYMDVISLYQAGITETVSSLGTALTELQLEEMWRLADSPILCFDGDSAGQTAAGRAAERALPRLKSGKSLLFATLPGGQDPDSIININGKIGMEDCINTAQTLSDKVWELAGGDDGNNFLKPENRASLNHRLNNYVDKIVDKDLKLYFRRYYRDLLYELPDKKLAFDKRGRRTKFDWAEMTKAKAPKNISSQKQNQSSLRERTILQTILNFPELLSEFHEELERLPFIVARYGAFRDALLAADVQRYESNKSKICYSLTQAGLEKMLDELVGRDALYLDWASNEGRADIKDARLQLRHALDLHHRLTNMENFRNEAEKALATEMTEENLRRLTETMRAVEEAPGTEVQIPGYRDNLDQS